MGQEKEVKFKVASHAAVRRALKRAGAKYLGTVLQSDTYYDTAGRSLLKGGRGLRIRTARTLRRGAGPADNRPLLTFKGPAARRAGLKARREIQTHLDDGQALAEILAACGLVPAATIQKRRASYRLGRCRVELDELPVIGRFVEIEAPGKKLILAAAARLDLHGEPITDHYLDLLARASKRFASGRRKNITF